MLENEVESDLKFKFSRSVKLDSFKSKFRLMSPVESVILNRANLEICISDIQIMLQSLARKFQKLKSFTIGCINI